MLLPEHLALCTGVLSLFVGPWNAVYKSAVTPAWSDCYRSDCCRSVERLLQEHGESAPGSWSAVYMEENGALFTGTWSYPCRSMEHCLQEPGVIVTGTSSHCCRTTESCLQGAYCKHKLQARPTLSVFRKKNWMAQKYEILFTLAFLYLVSCELKYV